MAFTRGQGTRAGRPTRMWGLPGCSPYALVLTVLCVALLIFAIARGDPAALVIAVALALLFVPLAIIAFLARRPDAWLDEAPLWDDESPAMPDTRNDRDPSAPPDALARDGTGRHDER